MHLATIRLCSCQSTDTSVYGVVQNAYRSLMVDKNISTTAPREDKKYFDAFNYLGWCTWEHYHFDIDEQKITKRHGCY